jgi:two-component system nitrate/nitrite response regulator NarL
VSDVIEVTAIEDDATLAEGLRAWAAALPGICLAAVTPVVDEMLRLRLGKRDVVLLTLSLRGDPDPVLNVQRLVRVSDGTVRPSAPVHGFPLLSEREQLVLMAYASGLTLDSVARRLGISRETARTYLKRVKAKYKRAGMPAYTKLDLADRLRASQAGRPDGEPRIFDRA